MKYTVYDPIKSKCVHCADWICAIGTAQAILFKTPTRNGFVSPVAIFNEHNVMVAVLSDDANGITVHEFHPAS